jgi:hypothetical protein
LLDATPNTEAPDEKEEERLKKEKKAEEQMKKIRDQLNLVRSYFGDML